MIRFHGIDRELRDAVVTASAAPDDGRIQLRPLGETVPRAGVQHDEALACRGKIEERLAIGRRVEELAIDADDGDVGLPDLRGRLVAIFGVVHAESGSRQDRAVGFAEEPPEIMRAAAADDEDLLLTGRPDDRFRLGQGSIPAPALLWRGSRGWCLPRR